MILIDRTETEPFFNIAAEEYVLKTFDEDVFMLWKNSPSVIVGKHQVAAAEADLLHTSRHNIPVIRRISGGGTVYHDEGNLNYSLVSNGEKGKLVDYLKYAGTVIRALDKLSVKAVLEGKSSLYTSGKKFSGNAEHVFRSRVLHHGTLLFNTDPEELRKCIRPAHAGYDDKAIRSVDSQTTNLIEHLPNGTNLEGFKDSLIVQVKEDFPGIKNYSFTDEDRKKIQTLVSNKYSGLEWNIGYSPKYTLDKNVNIGEVHLKIQIRTEKGRITRMEVIHDGAEYFQEVSDSLLGVLHHPEPIKDILNKINFVQLTNYTDPDAFIAGLF